MPNVHKHRTVSGCAVRQCSTHNWLGILIVLCMPIILIDYPVRILLYFYAKSYFYVWSQYALTTRYFLPNASSNFLYGVKILDESHNRRKRIKNK